MQEKREKVRILLVKYFLNVTWLVNQLNRRGFDVTPQVVNHYISGRRKPDNARRVIDASIDILEEYGRLYGERTE